MRFFVASDIHGSAYYCGQMLNAFEKEKADKLILLGDLLYHGPRNDLPKNYLPKEVAEMLNQKSKQILCVRGNCDSEVDQLMVSFPIMADYAYVALPSASFFITHGHLWNKDHLPSLSAKDILLHGHTHIPAWEWVGNHIYCNPGSVSIPKEQSSHGYMIINEDFMEWKTLDGATYHQLTFSEIGGHHE